MPNDLQVNADLEKSFRSYDQEVTINNIQLGCLLGMILMPAGAILDFFVYPSRVTFFLELRLACSALIGLFWIYVRSQAGRKKHRFLGVLLAMFPAFFISWMVLATDGAASKYYAGLNLVLLVVGFILHWTVRESLTATAAVLAMYMVACFGNDPYFLKEHRGDFANNLYFLILTGIIVVAGSGYHFRLRYREYALLFELDKSKKEIEQNHRKLQEIDQVKSRFFANISHELRTPLTLLLAPLESLAPFARRSLPPDKVELITTMQANGMRLLKLINDLLDLGRLESGRMQVKQEPLNVEAFIGGLIQSIKNVAMDKRIEVRSYIGHDVGNVLADRDKWEKILLNLMFNAIKFTPARG
ncbi:MAG: histidine kinase dimerization/phospho-acceptor domain-containing protein, partial [Verrucomicrobiota bacterium]